MPPLILLLWALGAAYVNSPWYPGTEFMAGWVTGCAFVMIAFEVRNHYFERG